MKKVLAIILVLAIFIGIIPLQAQAETSKNLLVNPSFEDGLKGWTCPDGKWKTVRSEIGYKPKDGKYFAWPKDASQEDSYIYQDVSLSGYKTGDSVIFNIMVCNFDQPPYDMGKVELKFLDKNGKEIKSMVQEQRNPNWNQQTIIGSIPIGATKVRVVLSAIWYVGADVDAYFDNASLVATTDKYSMVYLTEKDGKETAKKGTILTFTASNGVSKEPEDYIWTSSYNDAAIINEKGVATFITDAKDGIAFYAKDKKTGVVGVYWVNSDNKNKETVSGSEWASGELQRANEYGLVPDLLKNADLTQKVTRAEFAAIAVKVYEALSGKSATAVSKNPFTDCKDVEVLKAHNIGAVNGTSDTTFSPNSLLNREQAATMLTRVYKKVNLTGWTLATDSKFKLDYKKPATFADDKDISGYAKDSVYFMVANEVIKGLGDNKFAPCAITVVQKSSGYAQATREQALLIAVRMVERLSK